MRWLLPKAVFMVWVGGVYLFASVEYATGPHPKGSPPSVVPRRGMSASAAPARRWSGVQLSAYFSAMHAFLYNSSIFSSYVNESLHH